MSVAVCKTKRWREHRRRKRTGNRERETGIRGTKKILGISLDTNEIDELNVHEKAFESLHNLVFLNIYTKKRMMEEEERLHLPEGFNNFSPKLRLLCWDRYPISYMPSNFRPENLVKLQMQRSKLEKLWKGVCVSF
ncbi:hypothetical protein YC2023_024681 [Brassica napus]